MRLRYLTALPAVLLLACTSGGSAGRSSTEHATKPSQRATPSDTGTPPGTSPTTPRPAAYPDWPTYHGDAARTGYAPTMPAASGVPRLTGHQDLDGPVYASPLVVGGRVIVATENDTVYAFEGDRLVWNRHLGPPAQQSELPCGNIFPLGITGTPAYSDGRIYVAAEFGGPPRHELFALRAADGSVVWRHDLDLAGVQTAAMQERGALLVAAGRVWVPFGGLFGDCGGYKGRVIGVPLSGSGAVVAYTVPTTREAGIWAPPGAVFDGSDLFVAVGNGESTSGYDTSDSILKLDTSARLVEYFAPSTWADDNAADLDLGSQGPALVRNWVFIAGKRGTAYVLRRDHLGGIGGAVSKTTLCASFGGTAVVGSRIFVPCTDGLRAVRIDRSGDLHVLWHTRSDITGSPVVGGGRVWSLNPDTGRLFALDAGTGAVVDSVGVGGGTSRFATPAIYGKYMYVPTLTGYAVITTS